VPIIGKTNAAKTKMILNFFIVIYFKKAKTLCIAYLSTFIPKVDLPNAFWKTHSTWIRLKSAFGYI
jgi:hypothetical protein